MSEHSRKYYAGHKKEISAKVDRNKKSIYRKLYFKKNKERERENHKSWIKNNRDKEILYREREYKNRSIERIIATNLRIKMWKVLKKINKSKHTLELLGCSFEFLKEYLEKQFEKGMSWKNYGEWHIDHIKPCASFSLINEEEQKECFHYTNLRPLWAEENLSRPKKYVS